MSLSKRAKEQTPTLPELPLELWFNILQTAWTNLKDIGVKRLVCKRFAKQLRRAQHNEVFKTLVDKRNVERAFAEQQDATSNLSAEERGNRDMLRSVEYVGDARLYVFFKLLIHNMDPGVRREMRIKGIEALRECNRWFETADLR